MMRGDLVMSLAALAAILGALCVFVSLWHKHRRERDNARLALLREALQHPQLDERTRAELLRSLAHRHVDLPKVFEVVRVLWFAAGWLMFVGASCMLVLAWLRAVQVYDISPVAGTAAAGFAMLSLPLGLRELTRRDRIAAER